MMESAILLHDLEMYPYNTTLMGTIHGILDFYEYDLARSWVYGGSGHAFLINIHHELCPSGPYCWKYEEFYKLLQNIGLKMKFLGLYSSENILKEREEIEETIKEELMQGNPCSVLNFENQIISGFDHSGLYLKNPWPQHNLCSEKLTFGTWEEFGKEYHAAFYSYQKEKLKTKQKVIDDSLKFALMLNSQPDKFEQINYSIGLHAYDQWIDAIKQGKWDRHGNWWNGKVWWECRDMAANYLRGISFYYSDMEKLDLEEIATDLARDYKIIAKQIGIAKSRTISSARKIRVLKKARIKEEEAIEKIKLLIS